MSARPQRKVVHDYYFPDKRVWIPSEEPILRGAWESQQGIGLWQSLAIKRILRIAKPQYSSERTGLPS
jgi:hypothetical protein